jgi:hypothetical protein
MVYFGPYNPEALSAHMPVDHMLYATVEASESAVQAPTEAQLLLQQQQQSAAGEGQGEGASGRPSLENRRSMQRQESQGMHAVDSVQSAMNELDRKEQPAAAAPPSSASSASSGGGAGSNSPKIAAVHAAEEAQDELVETPEQVASQFSGTVQRLSARAATYVYWSAGGRVLGLLSLLVFMTTQTCRILSDLWIRQWSTDLYGLYASQPQYDATKTYILVYMGFVMAFIMLLLCRDSLFCFWSKSAATKLHNDLFSRVLGAPILFFLRTPLGGLLLLLRPLPPRAPACAPASARACCAPAVPPVSRPSPESTARGRARCGACPALPQPPPPTPPHTPPPPTHATPRRRAHLVRQGPGHHRRVAARHAAHDHHLPHDPAHLAGHRHRVHQLLRHHDGGALRRVLYDADALPARRHHAQALGGRLGLRGGAGGAGGRAGGRGAACCGAGQAAAVQAGAKQRALGRCASSAPRLQARASSRRGPPAPARAAS